MVHETTALALSLTDKYNSVTLTPTHNFTHIMHNVQAKNPENSEKYFIVGVQSCDNAAV